MQYDRSTIREGMTVFSSDGEKLGKVQTCDASTFVIEKGFFFPKDYIARYEEVTSVDGDDIYLAIAKDTFVSLREAGEGGWTDSSTTGTDYSRSARMGATGEDVRVPVAEEELDVVKRDRKAGEVRLRKDVVTETKHIDVPVTREEVHVERVAATDRTPTDDRTLFQKDTVSVPIHEEEIEITKRPVVKEEVRLRKDRFTEQRAAEADVRKERVDVEGDEGTRRFDRTDNRDPTRRMDELDESGRPRRAADDSYMNPIIPPRDDT